MEKIYFPLSLACSPLSRILVCILSPNTMMMLQKETSGGVHSEFRSLENKKKISFSSHSV
jgi:hypothetical protein